MCSPSQDWVSVTSSSTGVTVAVPMIMAGWQSLAGTATGRSITFLSKMSWSTANRRVIPTGKIIVSKTTYARSMFSWSLTQFSHGKWKGDGSQGFELGEEMPWQRGWVSDFSTFQRQTEWKLGTRLFSIKPSEIWKRGYVSQYNRVKTCFHISKCPWTWGAWEWN